MMLSELEKKYRKQAEQDQQAAILQMVREWMAQKLKTDIDPDGHLWFRLKEIDNARRQAH